MIHYRKILVPLDTSDLAARALDAALSIAEAFDAEVLILEVRPDAAPLGLPDVEVAMKVIDADSEVLLTKARALLGAGHSLPESRVRVEIRSGPLTDAIVSAAQEHMVDLIVMGTHGRQGLSEMFVGSTTERVNARTSASVLAVKPEGFPYLRD